MFTEQPSPPARAPSDDVRDPPSGHGLTVLRRLGSGAYGTVYAASDAARGGETVALKQVRNLAVKAA